MNYAFYQWKPEPEVHNFNDSNDKSLQGHDADRLLILWKRWRAEFPSALRLVTLTRQNDGWRGYPSIQLRLWFGEPASIHPDHVDSMGHNLIVHIDGPASERALYRLLRDHMVGDLQFTKEEVNGVEVWRRLE